MSPPRQSPIDPPPVCGCGHLRSAHRHFRRGSDCGLCGCGRYQERPPRVWERDPLAAVLEDVLRQCREDDMGIVSACDFLAAACRDHIRAEAGGPDE